jgi:hypothetical protein
MDGCQSMCHACSMLPSFVSGAGSGGTKPKARCGGCPLRRLTSCSCCGPSRSRGVAKQGRQQKQQEHSWVKGDHPSAGVPLLGTALARTQSNQ